MSVIIPESYKDLIEGPIVVTLATVMPNGQPHTAPVWCSYNGTHVIIETSLDTQKAKNVQANPRVSITALDPQNPYRYLEIRGVVEEFTEKGAMEVLDELTCLYTDKSAYYGHVVPMEEKGKFIHALCKIRPTKVIARQVPG